MYPCDKKFVPKPEAQPLQIFYVKHAKIYKKNYLQTFQVKYTKRTH